TATSCTRSVTRNSRQIDSERFGTIDSLVYVSDRPQPVISQASPKPPFGSPAEVDAYRKMLADIAEHAANASKEGGFLGFGGVRVSDKESAFISKVRRAGASVESLAGRSMAVNTISRL